MTEMAVHHFHLLPQPGIGQFEQRREILIAYARQHRHQGTLRGCIGRSRADHEGA